MKKVNILYVSPGHLNGFQGLGKALMRLEDEFHIRKCFSPWLSDVGRVLNGLDEPIIFIIHVDEVVSDQHKNDQLKELLDQLGGRAVKVIATTAGQTFQMKLFNDEITLFDDVIFGADDERIAMMTIKKLAAQLAG